MKPDSFRDFVLDQLHPLGDVEARSMFGGNGLYHDGVFFGILWMGRLYLKTTEATRVEFVKRGMKPFRPNQRQTLKSYYEVPVEIIENREALEEWARRAAETKSETRKLKPEPNPKR